MVNLPNNKIKEFIQNAFLLNCWMIFFKTCLEDFSKVLGDQLSFLPPEGDLKNSSSHPKLLKLGV